MLKVPPLHRLEVQLEPARDWVPGMAGWAIIHVVSGSGYWQSAGGYRELNLGDAFLVHARTAGSLLASRIGGVHLRWFWFEPESLSGVLTLPEMNALS